MAGWSMLSNGDCAATTDTKFDNRVCFEIDNTSLNPGVVDDVCNDNSSLNPGVVDDVYDDFKDVNNKGKDFLFYQYQNRSVFTNEVATRNNDKPIPPKLWDGRCVDLFTLFWVVREKGGFELVTKNGLWGLVTDVIGLKGGIGISSGVKMIYIKYLGELDHWFDKFLTIPQTQCGSGPSCSFKELAYEAPTGSNSEEAKNRHVNHKHDENCIVLSEVISVDKKDIDSRKRKHDSLSEMLNWVTELAKHPCDYLAKNEPKGVLAEARWAREVLLLRKHDDSKADQSALQKKQKMHPCMYEDPKASLDQFGRRLRCTERQPSLSNYHVSQQCDPCPATTTKIANIAKENPVATADIMDLNTTTDSTEVTAVKRSIPLGPIYQAVVPEWTGAVFDSDPKWLGTCVWPVDTRKGNEHTQVLDSIGKGREDSCDCMFPRSVECVRFHLSENRMALQLDLGSAFSHWRFHSMGEEVSLRWTPREEKRFKNMVTQNRPSQNKCFWDKASKHFPKMTKEKLVAYYFNVYVLRRRCYQNRVTPKDIDSDDDETGFGSFTESYGHEATTVSRSKKLLMCTQNREQTEIE